MSKIIKDWNDLVGLESDTHYLKIEVENGCGWVYSKSDDTFVSYLSTHTFYGSNYKLSTVALQSFGFDVQLENWDGVTEDVNYKDQWKYDGDCSVCRRSGYCSTKCKASKDKH